MQDPGRGAAAQWVLPKVEAENLYYKTFQSQAAGQNVSYLIYVPAGYDQAQDKRFPVVYWLHGIGGNQSGVPHFVERLDAAVVAGKCPPMLVVFVNGMKDSFYCDAVDGKTPVESVIVKDLIPYIDRTYRTVSHREGRIIEGFSMGGFGAAHLGFKYPELFGAVSIIDGALLELSTMQGRHAAQYEKFFGSSAEKFAAENPRSLIPKNAVAVRGKTVVRQAVGQLAEYNRSFHEQMTGLKIAHDYDAFEGVGHNQALIYDRLGDKNWEWYRKALASVLN